MAEAPYERLSALDQSFLAFETPHAPMHVAITAIFEPGSLTQRDGGIDIGRIRAHLASRLHLIPRYRQRLQTLPLLNDVVWVDDADFDLGYHVRHASLPRPGGTRQLQRRCAEILERHLDRARPLWEVWIIEGLESGRFAMLAKVHHCMVDGIAGIALLAALLGVAPTMAIEPAPPWRPRPVPRQRDLLADDLRHRGRAAVGAVRALGDWLRRPREAGEAVGSGAAAFVRLLGKLGGAPATPFNEPIGPHRRVDWWGVDLAAVKAIRAQCGATLNDVVLATVAGALGRFLAHRGCRLADELRIVVPVSVRAAAEHGATGNRVSLWLSALPHQERDPLRRLAAVGARTAELKAAQDARGAELLTQAAEWSTGNVVTLVARLINSARRFNLIVTNVPGPPVPFFLLDAPMVAVYPHLPLFENQGLGIALLSYAGQLTWGIGADWKQVADLDVFTAGLVASFEELRDAARVPAAARAPRAAAPASPPAAAAGGRGRRARTRAPSVSDGPRRAARDPRPATDRTHR